MVRSTLLCFFLWGALWAKTWLQRWVGHRPTYVKNCPVQQFLHTIFGFLGYLWYRKTFSLLWYFQICLWNFVYRGWSWAKFWENSKKSQILKNEFQSLPDFFFDSFLMYMVRSTLLCLFLWGALRANFWVQRWVIHRVAYVNFHPVHTYFRYDIWFPQVI